MSRRYNVIAGAFMRALAVQPNHPIHTTVNYPSLYKGGASRSERGEVSYIPPIISSPNSLVLSLVAPSIRRWKS